MPDTEPVTAAITRLIASGVADADLIATIARCYPDITRSEFMAALQVATAEAERQALRPH
jgi:hypothetical protein